MSHIICIGCKADLELENGPELPLHLKVANNLPIGQSIIRGKKGVNAYLVTDGHCSSDFFVTKERRRNELWNKLEKFIDYLFQELPIIWFVYHVYSGLYSEEVIPDLKRSKIYGCSNLVRNFDEDTLYVIYRNAIDHKISF